MLYISICVSECSKLAQKEYKTRYNWVGKVIHWKLCKKLKFDNTNKWNMLNPESVLENGTYKLLWDFEIQTDHLIWFRRPDHIIINKKERTCKIVACAVPADHIEKLKERKKRDEYLDIARKLKKPRNMKVTIIPIVINALGTVTKGLVQGLADLDIMGRVETIQTTALLRSAGIMK